MATHNIITKLPDTFTPIPVNPRFENLTGRRFGRITVIGYSHRTINTFWFVRCDCGVLKLLSAPLLKSGRTRSCGCLNKDLLAVSKTTHGYMKNRAYSPEVHAYQHAKRRCRNPDDARYYTYGARGIEFRFTSFAEFINHIGPRPDSTYSLNRIDNDGHYEIGNVEWAKAKDQARNATYAHIITIDGESKNLCVWAALSGIKEGTIRKRIKAGSCDSCAVWLPLGERCSHIRN